MSRREYIAVSAQRAARRALVREAIARDVVDLDEVRALRRQLADGVVAGEPAAGDAAAGDAAADHATAGDTPPPPASVVSDVAVSRPAADGASSPPVRDPADARPAPATASPTSARARPNHVSDRHGPISPIGVQRPVRDGRTGPRRHVVLARDAIGGSDALDVDAFHELRRLGLFDDGGRNPPPSWWLR